MPRIVAKEVDSQKGDGEATAARRELVDVAKMPAPQTSASGSNNNNTADATASANDNNNENNDSDSDMIGDSPSKNTRAAKKRKQEDAAPLPSDEDDDDADDDNVDIDAETTEWKKNKKKSKSKKKSAGEAKEKKEKILKWIEQMTMDHIVLTLDGNDVLSVGGRPWSSLKAYAKIAFISKNKIRVPSAFRSNNKYGECIANTVKAKQYVKSTGKKKNNDSSPLTKPTCLTTDGTLYRIIEVITALV